MAPDELAQTLRRAVSLLEPHRTPLVEAWTRALQGLSPGPQAELHAFCEESLDQLFHRLSHAELRALLADEAAEAAETAHRGESLRPRALAIRALDRCCLPFLIEATSDRRELGELLVALDELGDRRLEALVQAQEDEAARRLIEAQEQMARAQEKARELAQANEALKVAQAESQHRADQIGLVSSVSRRIASILDSDRLMQEAAEAIQTRANHTYVAVVVVDEQGGLVGRWAGRPGVGRRSSGRAQGPAGGVIGRAIRKKAPQVVMDVEVDPDYHADVPGTRSEMAVPLMEDGQVVGALDFQNERKGAFDLDDVAAGEAIAEFLVVALRNARLFAASRDKRDAAAES